MPRLAARLLLCLTAVLAAAATPLAAQAGARARVQPEVNTAAIHTLFNTPLPQVADPARHTFVFWVNGDQDHFEPNSSVPADATDTHPHLYRADSIEVSHILQIANTCPSCNVVILHDQRGSARWYTANKPWATYLRVYSRGRFLLQRHVDEVDETDPHLAAWLLNFAQGVFPQSTLHFIYRGHSFRAPYEPGSKTILPFDYSAREHGYGPDVFIESLQHAGLRKRLGSLTLAACSMAAIELTTRLAAYADYFVGSEVDVLEVLDVGFRFASLMAVRDTMDNRQVSWLLASRLLEAFKEVPVLQDAMMEFPTTWTDLAGMSMIRTKLNQLTQWVSELPPGARAHVYESIRQQTKLAKVPSARFVESLQKAGRPPEVIDMLVQQLSVPSPNPRDLDLGLMLTLLETWQDTAPMHDLATYVKSLINGYVHVVNAPESGGKMGLSISYQDAPQAFLPAL